MKKLNLDNRGASAVEFLIAFSFALACLLMAIELVFFALGGELMSYAAYMGSRSLKVNKHADVVGVVNRITPWVKKEAVRQRIKDSYVEVWIGSKTAPLLGKQAGFSILNNDLKLDVMSSMPIDKPLGKECEDNPLWYVAGGEECS